MHSRGLTVTALLIKPGSPFLSQLLFVVCDESGSGSLAGVPNGLALFVRPLLFDLPPHTPHYRTLATERGLFYREVAESHVNSSGRLLNLSWRVGSFLFLS